MLKGRLLEIYNLCPKCNVLADIGTDHGFLPVETVKSGKAKKAIACDISEGSLKKADKNVRFSGLSDKIDVRLGGGLSPLEQGEADCIVIAGMGGLLISSILKEGFDKIKSAKLILQPMSSVSDMRHELLSSGFCITDEAMVREDRRFYNIVCAKIGKPDLDYDTDIGSILIEKRDKSTRLWLEAQISELERILSHIKDTKCESYRQNFIKLEKYKTMVGEW